MVAIRFHSFSGKNESKIRENYQKNYYFIKNDQMLK
jgi:hypothetical protein